MSIIESSTDTVDDRREFASRKVTVVLDVPNADHTDFTTVGFWIETYLAAAVCGVRSPEVTEKIARHAPP